MDRRTFLKSSGAAIAASGATAAAQSAQAGSATDTAPELEIRTALTSEFATGYLRDRADRLALRLSELTRGRLQLVLTHTETTALAAVTGSEADAYFGTEADHAAGFPALAFFSAVPGASSLSPEQFATWLSAGGGQMLWDDAAAELGVKAFAAGHSGRSGGLWAQADIDTLSGFTSQTIATRGLNAKLANYLGLTVATGGAAIRDPLMGTTAYLSSPAAQDTTIRFRDGLSQHGTVLSLGVSRALWESLDFADQTAIQTATSEAYHQSLAEHDAHDTMVAPHLLKAKGVRQTRLPDDVRRAIDHVTPAVLDEVRSADDLSRAIYDSYMQFQGLVAGPAGPSVSPAAV